MALIKLKKSSTAAAAPTSGAMDYGELAINYADGILYYKDSSNVIKQIGSNATVEGAVLITGDQTIAGTKTFSGLATSSTALVTNLNAAQLNSQPGSFYQNATNLTAGTVASARISGSYTGITGVGALAAGSIASGFGAIDISGYDLTASNATITGRYLATSSATTGQPIFLSLNTSATDSLIIRYTEVATGSTPIDVWQFRLGGTAARSVLWTSFDSAIPFWMDIANGRLGINSTTAPAYNLQILGTGTEASPTTLSINAPDATTAGDSRIVLSQTTSLGDFQLLYAGTNTRTDSRTSNNAYIEQSQAINIRTKNNGSAFNSEVLVGGGIFFSTNATNSLAAERMRIDTSGNVGIATASPLLRLDVAGSGRFTGASTSVLTGTIDAIASTTVTGVGTLFLTELVVGDRITITGETRTVTAIASNLSLTVDIATTDTANDTSPDKLAAIFVTRLSSNAIGMVQNDLGNLGIGTAAPADKLHINAGDLRIGQSNSAADTITNNINFVNTNLANTPVAVISVRTGSAVAVSNLIFQTAASGTPSEKMRIAGDGNVGIGTTSPAYPLHVVGAAGNIIRYDRTSVGSFNTVLSGQLTGSAVDFLMTANQASSGYLWRVSNASNASINALSIDRNGNVGIGTTAPTSMLKILGAASAPSIVSSAAAIFELGSTAGTSLVFTNDSNTPYATSIQNRNSSGGANTAYPIALNPLGGNVGIGTTAPAYTLDVTGTGRFTSTLLVSGAATLSSTLAVAGAATLSSTLAVAGALTTTVGGGAGTGTQTMATQAYLNSRGMNLVANGIGALTNNYNFTGFVFDQTDTFTGKGSFKATHGTVASSVLSDEYIAIDIAKTYLLTLYAKTTQFTSLSTFYAGIAMFDIDNIGINPYNIMRQTGTDTRLLSPLSVNDMVVVVASLASWLSTSTLTYLRSIIIWGYRNSFLYTYPDYTYSRFWITDSYFSTGSVCQLVLTAAGTGYTAGTYALGFSGGAGTGAAGSYIVDSSASVVAVYMTAEGSGYTSAPTVSFPSGGGTAAAATARITTNATVGTVEYLVKGASGSGYTGTTGTITFSGGGATTQATGYVTINSGAVDRIILQTQGSGYTSNPTVTITAGGTGATAYATIGTGIDATNNRIYLKSPFSSSFQNPVNSGVWPIGTALSNGNSGGTYKYIAAAQNTVPTAWTKFTGKIGGIDTSGLDTNSSLFRPGTATVRIMFLPNYTSITNCVISTTVSAAGSGYTSIPALTFGTTPTAGSLTATGSAVMGVVSATISSGGTGYGVGNIISVTTGTGTAATFQVATVSAGVVATITALNTGGAYTVLPTLSAVATTANPAGGTGLTLNLSMGIGSVTILTSGSGYSSGAPLLTSAASAGVTATLSCTLGNNIQNYSTISFTEVSDRNVAVFQPTTTTEVGLAVRQLSGQTAAIQEWQNSGATVLASIGTSGQFLAGNTGSAASPGYAFTGDTGTGMYRSAASTLQLVTGGVARVTIDSVGNLNGPAGAHFNIVPAATYSLILNGNVSTAGSTTTTIGGAITVAGLATFNGATTINSSLTVAGTVANLGRYTTFSAGGVQTNSFNDNTVYFPFVARNSQPGVDYGTGYGFALGYGGGQLVNGTSVAAGDIAMAQETTYTSTVSTQDSYMRFSTSLDGTVAEKMRITSAGNVGIGTTAPTSPLTIIASSTVATASITNSAASPTTFSGLLITGTNNNTDTAYGHNRAGGSILLRNADSTAGTYSSVSGQNSSFGTSAAILFIHENSTTNQGAMAFFTRPASGSFAEVGRFSSTGSFGIGTTSPTNILSLGNGAARKFWIENSATDVVGRALTVAAGGTIAGTSTSNVAGGNLILQSGLGTGTGASAIEFQTGTTLTTGLTLQTMSTKMTILGSGNVGIGTATPAYTLDVTGIGRFTGGVASTTAINIASTSTNTAYDAAYLGFRPGNAVSATNIEYYWSLQNNVTTAGPGQSNGIKLYDYNGSEWRNYIDIRYNSNAPTIKFGDSTAPGSGTLLAATFSGTLAVAGTITGSSTVQGTRLISTIATGTAPLTVTSTTAVTNLNADLLDGQEGTYYQNATNLNAGTVATARLASGTANATAVLRGDQTWGAPIGIVPIGTVLSWLKSFNSSAAGSLPATGEFVECNGQVLSTSPYTAGNCVYFSSNGTTPIIPNLNGANSGTQRFLRGSTVSGATGGTETHTHVITSASTSISVSGTGTTLVTSVTSPTGSTSTLPSYYEVVWIMRVM